MCDITGILGKEIIINTFNDLTQKVRKIDK